MIFVTPYSCMSTAELAREYATILDEYDQLKAQGLKLNMARGKPAKKQLDLVSGILTTVQTAEDCLDDGIDVRNYGELAGLPCAKGYWADIPGIHPRPAPQPPALVPGGEGQVPVPLPRL